ncbi:Calx-beta domain protein [Gimesia panareensis]|uniref:Calx-beta domain protein n=1 Tax=Gimesia panareensis TaxID=2527978 RepID=A0A518FLY7_9PLAN|nr:Calx-beta domain-containing protein [Gimesia panareensis]QDV17339.1 Calx-beta domain protein [Gimesia panareensis]
MVNNAGSIYVYGLPQNPTITIDDVSVTEENDGSHLLTANVTRTATKPGDLIYGASVDFRTLDGTATVAGGDYENTTGTITFESDPNASTQTQTISIRVYGDNVAETDETFRIELLNLIGHARLPESAATVTIKNDDQAMLSIEDVTVNEDAFTAQVTVTLDAPVEAPLTVNYATTDLTTTVGEDYLEASGTLTFNPLETSKTITIYIVDYPRVEADETFQIDLTQIQTDTDVRFADDQAIVTILDDDQAAISIGDLTINESASRAYLTVSVDNTSDIPYTFDYATVDQSASAPDDYLSKTGTITLNPGHLNATISIDLVNGIPVEPMESFAVQLSNLQTGGRNVIFADDEATVTIVDDDLTRYDWDSKLYSVGTKDTNDQFSFGVATDGDTLISTSLYWNATYAGQGAAFVYVRNDQGTPDDKSDDTWDYQDTLLVPYADATPDLFGWSVDISGDTAVVGAFRGDGIAEDMGSVYVFTRSDSSWTFQQELTAKETAESGFFGDVVAIENDTIVVGARTTENNTGSAYVFERTNGVWTRTARLIANDAIPFAYFGNTVDIDNSTIVIGARFDPEDFTRSGAVYIFKKQTGTWTQTQKIKDESPILLGSFGTSVSLSGDLLLVGATSSTDRAESTGKAILYQYDSDSDLWNPIQTLTASDSTLNSFFGSAVKIEDQQIFISSASDPTGLTYNGAVYLFELKDQTWIERQKISSPDAEYGDQFGRHFALADDTLFIGAQYDNDYETNAGSVYVYKLTQKPAITIEDVSVTEEDDGSRLITANVTRTATKPGELLYGASVDFRTLDGTARVAGGDYDSTSGTITFESDPTASSQTRSISIRIYGDPLPETDETFGIELLNVTGHAQISDPDATVTILNDDQSTLNIDDISVNEDAGFATVTVSLTQPLETSVSFDYATADQTAESGTDYTSTSGTLTFNPGVKSQAIAILITDSDLVELDETFLVNLSNLQTSDSNVILGDSQAQVTILNDDQASFVLNDLSVSEDVGNALITVTLDNPVDSTVSVSYGTLDLTTNDRDDFLSTYGTLTFNPGEQQKTVSVPIVNSDLVEIDERFGFSIGTLESHGRDVSLGDNNMDIWILDDDQAHISINDITVNESDGTATLTVSLDKEVARSVSFDYATADQTASSPDDYQATSGTISLNPNELSKTITVSLANSDLIELDETFLVNLSHLQTNSLDVVFADAQGQVTIRDDDQAAISIDDVLVDENAGTATLTVSLSQPVDTTISVDYATADQTAVSSDDYSATAGSLTFSPGEQAQTIVIPITDIDLVEGEESFFVNLSGLQANGSDVILGDSQGQVTIQDDDQATLSIDDVTVNEAAGTATLTVSLNQFVDTAISVDFATADQSAVQTDDYSATTGTLTIDPGELSQTITIAITDSDLVESDETLLVNLSGLQSNGRNVSIADSQGQVTILDDDQATISIDDAVVSESDGTVSLTVSLSQAVDNTINIDYATADQSAVSPTDYQSATGTLTFNPGETSQTVIITINDSDQVEADETFLVNLSSLQTHGSDVVSGDIQGQITIQDDDQAAFSIDDVTVNENAGTATLTVTLTGSVDTTVSVDYATADQTATAGEDFTSTSGTLTFNPGVESQTIIIPIIDSDLIENHETFLVNLSGIQSAGHDVILTDGQAQVTIKDDEQAPAQINLRVVEQPTATSSNGEVATLPTGVDRVSEWATWWVELWIDAQNMTNQGVYSAALDLSYQTEFTTATEIEFGPAFTQNLSGLIDDTAGSVTSLSGNTDTSHLGASQHLLFARIKFQSRGDDQVQLDLNGKSVGPYDLGLEISSPQVALEGNVPLDTTAGAFTGTDIWANPYDLNDDNHINFRDLILFVSVYNTRPSASDSDYAWFADLNQNDRVDFKDLIFLASNYNKGRENQISYPASFPDVWNHLLTVNPQSQPQEGAKSLQQSTAQEMLDSTVEEVSPQLSEVESQKLETVHIQVTDLEGDTLGRAAGNTIYIDSDAAGYGWFIDATPTTSEEFTESSDLTLIALPDSAAAGRIDLWTVIRHELGHLLGYDHEETGWMQNSLLPGVRKLPTWENEADQFFTDLTDDLSIFL